MDRREFRKRVNFDMPTPLYKAMKDYCADRGLNMTKFFVRAVLFYLRDVKRPDK